MNILFVTTGLTKSGGMRVISRLADNLIDLGNRVTIISPIGSVPYFPTFANLIHFSSAPFLGKYFGFIYSQLSLLINLLRVGSDFDVIIATHNTTAFQTWIATRKNNNGIYYVQAYEPDFYNNKLTGRIFRQYAKFTYKLNLSKIVNSSLYLSYKDLSAEFVVEPGIDLTVFSRKITGNSINKGEVVIGCIGREASWKGTKEIIQAVNAVADVVKLKFGLNIVMNVAYFIPPELLNVSKIKINFHEPHGDENLSEFYKINDIFVATGLMQDQAFHYPCMEALASGCIVLSNYQPASANNSYIIENVNENKIRDKLIDIISDILSGREIKISNNELSIYSWPNVARKFNDILINRH